AVSRRFTKATWQWTKVAIRVGAYWCWLISRAESGGLSSHFASVWLPTDRNGAASPRRLSVETECHDRFGATFPGSVQANGRLQSWIFSCQTRKWAQPY